MLARQALPTVDAEAIARIAANSSLARVHWKERGRAPIGYIKGMAVMFAVVLRKLVQGDSAALDMARAASEDSHRDALVHYQSRFAALGMRNDVSGIDTLRHLFVLLIGLGMRESSGNYAEGRDRSASNTTADTAEAGLFQMSWDAHNASSEIPRLLEEYQAQGGGYREIFAEGVKVKDSGLVNLGSGKGATFQRLCKECPGFAVEVAAVGLRHRRKHWGPINRLEAELRPEADELLLQVQEATAGATLGPLARPTVNLTATEVRVVQEQLRRLNYPPGDIDGVYGPLTRAALLAFQADNNLPKTGLADAATVAALSTAQPRPLDPGRITVTPGGLAGRGSDTIVEAVRTKLVALISSILGALGIGNSAVTQIANTSVVPPVIGTAGPVTTQLPSGAYQFLADLVQALSPPANLNAATVTRLTNELGLLQQASLKGMISPENIQAIDQLRALLPRDMKMSPELAAIFQQAAALRPVNPQLHTIVDVLPTFFANGSVLQSISDGLATAASSIVPGFGGSLTMLGIGLAARYFSNQVIAARVQDHATAGNRRR